MEDFLMQEVAEFLVKGIQADMVELTPVVVGAVAELVALELTVVEYRVVSVVLE
jgi:hypothetical protein